MTNIFEYLNIFDPNIYSDIHSYQNFGTNIFGYSFVSTNFIQIYLDIHSCRINVTLWSEMKIPDNDDGLVPEF